jgi:hypothetical protein
MSAPSGKYTQAQPLCREPEYVRQIRATAENNNGVAAAVATAFHRARIYVTIDGDTTAWRNPGCGTLLITDHRDRCEFAPLLAMLGVLGREDIHFIAKPFAISARVINSLGPRARGITLPVIPRTLARDRPDILNRDLGWRITQLRNLPTYHELNAINAATLTDAATLLDNGELVVIHPTGATVDATVRPWHRGLGTILKTISPAARPHTRIVLARFDHFATTKLVRRLALQGRGITPNRPYVITLRVRINATISQLLDNDATTLDALSAVEITQRLRDLYVRRYTVRTRPNSPAPVTP